MQTAKIFQSGNSQAVRLPKEFRFDSDEVGIKRVGTVVVLYDPNDRYHRLTSAMEQFTGDFMADGRDQGAEEVRKPVFD
jgi:antitoxin VapB